MEIKQEILNIRKRNLDKITVDCPSCHQLFDISILELYCSSSFDCPTCGLYFICEKSRPF